MQADPLDRWRTAQGGNGRPDRPGGRLLGAVAGLAAAVLVVLVVAGRGGRGGHAPTTAPASGPATTAPASGPATPAADPPPFRFDGAVLETPEGRWSLGRPGDIVALGDWRCDGRPTPAVLRPATGDVFRLDAWARADADVTVPALTRVGGARDIRAADVDSDGCPELVVDRADGPALVLRGPGR